MNLHQNLRRVPARRLLLLGLSLLALLVCVFAGTAHYHKASWGDPWQPIGWLLSMLFLLAAFAASPRELAGRFKSLANPKAAFFLFWILFFVISHLWNFRNAPWNGDALFDESGWDLWYLKSLCYRSSISAGLVSYCHFARDSVSLLRLGLSEAVRL